MKFIAHRGNTNGKSDLENNPIHILSALQNGFDAEVDLWVHRDSLFLGHDFPEYKINLEFLNEYSDRLWIHCKNYLALELLEMFSNDLNFFWHQNDSYTLTSKGYIWIYPGLPVVNGRSISVMPESVDSSLEDIGRSFGVCSDNVEFYRSYFGINHE